MKKFIFIRSRPQNRAIYGADGAWPLSIPSTSLGTVRGNGERSRTTTPSRPRPLVPSEAEGLGRGSRRLILGGARSGKSRYAVDLAKKLKRNTAFIATAAPFDEEMRKRIKAHKKSRPKHWKLVEEGRDIGSALANLKNKYETILVDCLGLWISNLLAENLIDKEIEKEIKNLAKFIPRLKANIILVSNEVGSGVVPDNLLARRFRDLVGLANQMMAKIADEVIFMQSGIPLTIKGERKNAEIKRNIK